MDFNGNTLSFQEILLAQQRIKDLIHHTPLLHSELIDQIAGIRIYFKCENFQKIGAFKFRGASHVFSLLTDEQASKGLCTHSSGNHAQAVAKIAQMKKIPAYIVMPNQAPKIKKEAVLDYGAHVILCEPNLKAREEGIAKVIEQYGAHFIHPYEDPRVIAGQGTAIVEALDTLASEQIDVDAVMAPIGGGGLMAGTCIATKGWFRQHQKKEILIYGAEPTMANDAQRSLALGIHQKSHQSGQPNTICDGLLTTLGSLNYEILSQMLSGIYDSNDDDILKAMSLIWTRMKILIEPSSATVLSAVLSPQFKDEIKTKKIKTMVLILSGGNVDIVQMGSKLSMIS